MPHRAPLPPLSCYGCIHLKYKGPIGVLPDDETADELLGNYQCRLFSESRGPANDVPRPLLSRCKETR